MITLIMLHDIHKFHFFLFNSCRLLQGVETRTAAKDVMLGLPRVPTCCLSLLRLLVHTGTRAIAPPQGDGSTRLRCTKHLVTIHHITHDCVVQQALSQNTSHHTRLHCTTHLVTVHHITHVCIVQQALTQYTSHPTCPMLHFCQASVYFLLPMT